MRVDQYTDEAKGVVGKNAQGKTAMLSVTLHPRVAFSGERRPARADLDALHALAHEECFIANSVTTEVRCEPVWDG
jgi:organic hydroperoxide reductase OsmC/OhrA